MYYGERESGWNMASLKPRHEFRAAINKTSRLMFPGFHQFRVLFSGFQKPGNLKNGQTSLTITQVPHRYELVRFPGNEGLSLMSQVLQFPGFRWLLKLRNLWKLNCSIPDGGDESRNALCLLCLHHDAMILPQSKLPSHHIIKRGMLANMGIIVGSPNKAKQSNSIDARTRGRSQRHNLGRKEEN